MIKNFCLILLAVVLSACALNKIDKESLPAVKNIAVYSAVGPTLYYDHLGLTILSNDEGELDVTDWKVDDMAEQKVVSLLSAKGYKAGTIKAADFQRQTNASPEEVKNLIGLARAEGYDTLIVLTPYELPWEHNVLHIPRAGGYGVARRTLLGMGNTFMYVLVKTAVYDTASGENVGWSPGYSAWSTPPWGPVSDWEWHDNPADNTPEQMTRLKTETSAMFDRVLTFSVGDTGL